MKDVTERFSDRAENYAKYRPSYPIQVIELLERECGLTRASVIADVGSGTGILTKLFLDHGNKVSGVEPNKEMREAAERLLASHDNFVSIDGRSEATGLPDQSVDFITVAQAFHWFDFEPTQAEFRRILHPGGWCAIIWNDWRSQDTPFHHAYGTLLQKYMKEKDPQVAHHTKVTDESVTAFFAPGTCRDVSFLNECQKSFEMVKGGVLSASYAPNVGDEEYESMVADLQALFDEHATDGFVQMDYTTRVYYGRLG